MDFNKYSKKAITTLTGEHGYGDIDPQLMAQVLGLTGESSEIAEKFKKLIRDKKGRISEEDRLSIIKELGDILWYINTVATLMGSSLEEVADKNLEKLLSRKERGKIHGNGDDR